MLKYSVGVSTRVSHYLGKEGCSKLFHISKGKSIMHLFIGLGLGVVSTNNVDGLFNGSDRVQGGVGSYVPSLSQSVQRRARRTLSVDSFVHWAARDGKGHRTSHSTLARDGLAPIYALGSRLLVQAHAQEICQLHLFLFFCFFSVLQLLAL